MCASIQIFVIVLMVQSGLAIKCFNCDSESNARCANMTDPNLIAEECNFNKQMELESSFFHSSDRRHWLIKLSDFQHHSLKNEFDAKLICQKLIGIDEKKHVTVVRRCQIANILPCNYSRRLTTDLSLHVDCHICDEDGCNGATNSSVLGMLIGFVSAVAVLKHFVF